MNCMTIDAVLAANGARLGHKRTQKYFFVENVGTDWVAILKLRVFNSFPVPKEPGTNLGQVGTRPGK